MSMHVDTHAPYLTRVHMRAGMSIQIALRELYSIIPAADREQHVYRHVQTQVFTRMLCVKPCVWKRVYRPVQADAHVLPQVYGPQLGRPYLCRP